jgi:AraC family transcriptional regulator
MQASARGPVELAPLPDHRLSLYTGAPARLCHACRAYEPGDIDIMPAGFSATWVEEAASVSLVIDVPTSLVQDTAEQLGLDPDRASLAQRQQVRDPQIEYIGWALETERRAGHPNGQLYVESLGTALAVHLLGRYAAPRPPWQGLSRRQLRRVTEYIEAHLDQDLSLARLASVAAISTSHLKTSFKRATGVTVHRYVVQRRVARAKTLLLRGDRAVSDVALEAGFAHQSHMMQWMRRLLGATWRDADPT